MREPTVIPLPAFANLGLPSRNATHARIVEDLINDIRALLSESHSGSPSPVMLSSLLTLETGNLDAICYNNTQSLLGVLSTGSAQISDFGSFVCGPLGKNITYTNSEQISIQPFSYHTDMSFPWSLINANRLTAFARMLVPNSTEWEDVAVNISWNSVSTIGMIVLYQTQLNPLVVQMINVSSASSQASIVSSNVVWSTSAEDFPDVFLFTSSGIFLLVLITFLIFHEQTSWIQFALLIPVFTTTGYRIYCNIQCPAGSSLSSLKSFNRSDNSSTTQSYVYLLEDTIMWVNWDAFIATIEFWTSLLMVAILFARFSFRLWHLMFNFFLVFACFGAIGWLSFGDSTTGLETIWQVYQTQFGMLSSNWPSDLFVRTQEIDFILWLISNACVCFCGLYNFYQAVLENEYSKDGWFLSQSCFRGWFTNFKVLLDEIESVRMSKGKIIPLVALKDSISEKYFAFLERSGCIQQSLVVRPRRFRRDRYGKRLHSYLVRSEGVYNWLCMNLPRADQASSKILTDEDLQRAIERSFEEYHTTYELR